MTRNIQPDVKVHFCKELCGHVVSYALKFKLNALIGLRGQELKWTNAFPYTVKLWVRQVLKMHLIYNRLWLVRWGFFRKG